MSVNIFKRSYLSYASLSMNGVNLFVHKGTASVAGVITSVFIVYRLLYMFIIMLSKMNSKMPLSQSLSF